MKLVGKIIGASIFGVLTIALSIGSGIAKHYEPQLNLVLNATTQKIIPDSDAKIYYWTDYTDESNQVTEEEHQQWVRNRIKEVSIGLIVPPVF